MKKYILLLMVILVFGACENTKDPLPPDDLQESTENFLELRGKTYAITSASYSDLGGLLMLLLELEKDDDVITILYLSDTIPIGTLVVGDKYPSFAVDIVTGDFEYGSVEGKAVFQRQDRDSLFTIYSEDMVMGQSYPSGDGSYPVRFYFKGLIPYKNPDALGKRY